MKYCINVSFNENKKSYYFSTENENIKNGDFVVVNTVIGTELGKVVGDKRPIEEVKTTLEIKPIISLATKADLEKYENNVFEAKKAAEVFRRCVEREKLEMDLIETQYTLDKAKVLFTYISSDRVDFRNLLKLLAQALHCRIELKQVSPRERAQLIGGIGVCGLPLCCSTFLKESENISLNRAKNQMLSINIPKLSGQCGKLMCCLKFEDDAYTLAKKDFPTIGTKVIYDKQEYKVTSLNILSKVIKIENENNVNFIPLDDFKKLTKRV